MERLCTDQPDEFVFFLLSLHTLFAYQTRTLSLPTSINKKMALQWKTSLYFLLPTWVVAGQTCSASKHLPKKRGIILSVFLKYVLQSLGPVQLVQHNGC